MRRPRSWWLSLLVLTGIASAAVLWHAKTAPLPPLEVAIWYWHQPFHLQPAEVSQLKGLGVRQLFVRAGTFHRVGDEVRLTLPQQWASRADGLDIHLVFNFGYDVVRRFDRLSNGTIAEAVYAAEQQAQHQATQAGLQVAGLQLDFDCPTRLLPKYAQLLAQIQALHKDHVPLSITGLPTWFTSDKVGSVLNAVDFIVPQYYEANIPKSLSTFTPISNLHKVERGLKIAGQWGKPFYAGLPAYGHALAYDAQGQLCGTFHDANAREVQHNPLLRLRRTFPTDARGHRANTATYVGEDICDFVATTSLSKGLQAGSHLIYDLPTPTLLMQHLALVQAQRPRNCRGVILFRYPEAGETATLPLPSLAAVLRGQNPQPHLRVQMQTQSDPWELIEAPNALNATTAQTPLDLLVSVTNTGAASTFTGAGAATLTLCFEHTALEQVEAHDFDSVQTFSASSMVTGIMPHLPYLRSSVERANIIEFQKFHLAAGETAKIGPIRIKVAKGSKIWGLWSAEGSGGFQQMQDKIAPTQLAAPPGGQP